MSSYSVHNNEQRFGEYSQRKQNEKRKIEEKEKKEETKTKRKLEIKTLFFFPLE